MTIVARMVTMGAAGLVSVGLVAGFAVYSSGRLAAANRDITSVSDGMSQQWNADMMHDALRADVMAAMYARGEEQRAEYAVEEVAEHGATMLENYDAAAALAPADLRAEYVRVRPAVADYAETAAEVVDAAGEIHTLIGRFRY